MEDYVKSLSLYKCDVAMVEPALYDQFYDSITSINYLNNKEVNQTLIDRMNDPIDGEIYSELIKDIIIGDKVEVKAFVSY